jgi:hypothetical protein
MTRSPSFRDGFVDRLSGFSFLPPYYPSYRALASTLARLSSLNAPAFRWTHLHAGLARRTVMGIFHQLTSQAGRRTKPSRAWILPRGWCLSDFREHAYDGQDLHLVLAEVENAKTRVRRGKPALRKQPETNRRSFAAFTTTSASVAFLNGRRLPLGLHARDVWSAAQRGTALQG